MNKEQKYTLIVGIILFALAILGAFLFNLIELFSLEVGRYLFVYIISKIFSLGLLIGYLALLIIRNKKIRAGSIVFMLGVQFFPLVARILIKAEIYGAISAFIIIILVSAFFVDTMLLPLVKAKKGE